MHAVGALSFLRETSARREVRAAGCAAHVACHARNHDAFARKRSRRSATFYDETPTLIACVAMKIEDIKWHTRDSGTLPPRMTHCISVVGNAAIREVELCQYDNIRADSPWFVVINDRNCSGPHKTLDEAKLDATRRLYQAGVITG